MEINKYNNIKPFMGADMNKENKKNENRGIEKLIDKCADVLKEEAERRVPENNKFSRVFAAFNVPDANYEAFISISHDELEPKNTRRISVEIGRVNSDRNYMQYIFKGTKKEILEFLAGAESRKSILKSAAELMEAADRDF